MSLRMSLTSSTVARRMVTLVPFLWCACRGRTLPSFQGQVVVSGHRCGDLTGRLSGGGVLSGKLRAGTADVCRKCDDELRIDLLLSSGSSNCNTGRA